MLLKTRHNPSLFFVSFPFAVVLYDCSLPAFWVGIIFLIILTIGFIYEWSKGALYFTRQRFPLTSNYFVKLNITIIFRYSIIQQMCTGMSIDINNYTKKG
jgi:hypothetical protein